MRFSFRSTWFLSTLLILAVLLVYGQTAWFGFVSIDDGILVLKNPLIQSLDVTTLHRMFTSYDPELYVPLTMLSYHTDFALGGLTPSVYHLHNILLHLLCTLLVLWIFLRLGLQTFAAFFGALLFAVHPINTEAVSWVAARKDLLSTFYGLLSIAAFLSYTHAKDRRWYALAIVTFALGLLSKVTILLLPAFFFILLPRDHSLWSRLRTLLPFIVLGFIFAIIAIIGKMQTFGAAIPLPFYPILAMKATYLMMLHFLVPRHLSPLYPEMSSLSLLSPDVFVSIVVVFVLGALAYAYGRKNIFVRFGVTLFLVGLLPSFLTFTKNGELYVTSDRYAYLASVGLFFLIAFGLHVTTHALSAQKSVLRYALTTLLVALIFFFSFLSIRQARFWSSNETLMRRIIAMQPMHALAYNNLGAELRAQKKNEEAMMQYAKAISLDPHFILPHINLASLYVQEGKNTEAEAEYRRAIAAIDTSKRVRSDDLIGYYLLGDMLIDRGDAVGALALFKEAATIAPDIAEAWLNLGLTLHRFEKLAEAEAAYKKALTLDAHLVTAHYNLAEIFAGSGRLSEALTELDAVLALDPSNEQARVHRERIAAILAQ